MNTTVFSMVNKIHPIAGFIFEQLLLAFSDRLVDVYKGGKWKSKHLTPELLIGILPVDETRVRVVNPENFCDVTTDPVSAGAGMTLLALNHTLWKMNSMSAPDSLLKKMNDLYYELHDAVFADNATHGLDTGSIYRIID